MQKDINVQIPGLEKFTALVEKNAGRFDKIKGDLRGHLNELRDNDFKTAGADDFGIVFQDSEKDIRELVETMKAFAAYLKRKIGQATDIHEHRVKK